MKLSRVRQMKIYLAIYEENQTHGYAISKLCKIAQISRSSYYKWLNRKPPENELINHKIADIIKKIHQEYPDKGYRRIRDDLSVYYGIDINDKRVLRICRSLDVKSSIKYHSHGCTRQAKNPQHIAENILNREFKASAPNQK